MAELQNNESDRNQENRNFWTGRKWALIGLLLMLIFVIVLVVGIFLFGSLSGPHGSNGGGVGP